MHNIRWASLSNHPFSPVVQPLCVYGGPAYPLRIHLQEPFRKTFAGLTSDQEAYNKAMNQVRTSEKWIFGDIIKNFAFLD